MQAACVLHGRCHCQSGQMCCTMKQSLQPLHRVGPLQDMQLFTSLLIYNYAFMSVHSPWHAVLQIRASLHAQQTAVKLSTAVHRKQELLVTPCCAHYDSAGPSLSASLLRWLCS